MKTATLATFALVACTIATTALAQGRGFRGGRGGHGPDANFAADRDDFHFLLEHHDDIRRTVNERKDGVETTTESDNKQVAAHIKKHVAAMYQRVEHKRPIRMRDPLFAEIFKHAEKINMQFENTAKGVRVIETSHDPYVASLIKAHAKVVSRFTQYGFDEAHKPHAVPGKPAAEESSRHSPKERADSVFAEFDRVYIPALALTNQNKPSAMNAVGRLSNSWNSHFVRHFYSIFADDPSWPLDLSRIAQSIALAELILEHGESMKAHEVLEPIRDILVEARLRNNMQYALDSISQFHATMEGIVKPAMELESTSLDPDQLQRFKSLARQAEQEWAVVENTTFDLTLYGKRPQQQKQFASLLRDEGDSIHTFNNALSADDHEAIIKAARGLKPPFAKVYMFFGDFPTEDTGLQPVD